MPKKIIYKTAEQVEHIRHAGKHLTILLRALVDQAQPWVALLTLEKRAEDYLQAHQLTGSFKGYQGYPANLCLSVNSCVVHGIPDETILMPGDLLKIDAGVTYQGMIADSAVSVVIGGRATNPQATQLIMATKEALDAGIKTIVIGESMFPFGETVYNMLTQRGCAVIRQLTGHGVWTSVHEGPYIYNRPYHELRQQYREPGLVVALEPITAQTSETFIEKQGVPRNLYTHGGDLWAQREYTIACTEHGIEILAGVTTIDR